MPLGNLVIDTISSSIKSSTISINKIWDEAERAPDELADVAYQITADDQELVEHLMGISFVMCQVGITHIVSTYQSVQDSWVFHQKIKHKNPNLFKDFWGISTQKKVSKNDLMRKGNPILSSGYSQIETINAFANYFKHNDEWNSNWVEEDDNDNITRKIIKASGAKNSVEVCKEGFSFLLNREPLDQNIKLWEMVDKWADSIKQAFDNDLIKCGCI